MPLPDMVELLETQGVCTGAVALPQDISGLTSKEGRTRFFVVADAGHQQLRIRFPPAHEHAHVLADGDRSGLVSRPSQRDNLIEVRANAFAAAFLMPEGGMRQFVASLGKGKPSRTGLEVFDEEGSLDVHGRAVSGSQSIQLYDVRVAHRFGVSRIAALYRLHNLRLMTEPEFDRLKAVGHAHRARHVAGLLGLRD